MNHAKIVAAVLAVFVVGCSDNAAQDSQDGDPATTSPRPSNECVTTIGWFRNPYLMHYTIEQLNAFTAEVESEIQAQVAEAPNHLRVTEQTEFVVRFIGDCDGLGQNALNLMERVESQLPDYGVSPRIAYGVYDPTEVEGQSVQEVRDGFADADRPVVVALNMEVPAMEPAGAAPNDRCNIFGTWRVSPSHPDMSVDEFREISDLFYDRLLEHAEQNNIAVPPFWGWDGQFFHANAPGATCGDALAFTSRYLDDLINASAWDGGTLPVQYAFFDPEQVGGMTLSQIREAWQARQITPRPEYSGPDPLPPTAD